MVKIRLILWVCVVAECVTLGGTSGTKGDTHPLLVKRSATRPCAEKFQRVGTHSACAAPAVNSTRIEVTAEDKENIVNSHNEYRSIVRPTASNMLKMSWDEEIAMIAAAWAQTCSFKHDEGKNRDIPGRFSLGQNIGRGFHTWTALIDAWFGEVNEFTFGGSNDFHKVGHYTQGVWAETSKIGCGLARCGNVKFHVCNYGPAGNVEGSIGTPYTFGPSCSTCPGHCDNNLCDCCGLACENGGTMNRTTCTCQCKHEWHVHAQCQLDCSEIKEPWYCGKDPYDRAGCDIYANVPFDCPVTCEVCPYADYRNGLVVNGGTSNECVSTEHRENMSNRTEHSENTNGTEPTENQPNGRKDDYNTSAAAVKKSVKNMYICACIFALLISYFVPTRR